MNDLPLHPAIVHLPLGLAAVVPLVATALAVAIRRRALPARAWLLVVGLQAIVFGGGLVAQRTGEGDEDRVEDRVGKAAVERHEERAERFLWGAGTTLALSAAPLVVAAAPATAATMAATAVASVVTVVLAVDVGHSGGAIVHGTGGLAAASGTDRASRAGRRLED